MTNPINTAPKDATPILADCGIVRWAHYQPGKPDWYYCDAYGYVFECASNGPAKAMPTHWDYLPDWVS